MHHKVFKKTLILLATVSILFAVMPLYAQQLGESPQNLLQSSQCGSQDVSSYTALLPIPENYNVFIKLGKADQTAPASLFIQSFADGKCKQVGVLVANGTNWQKIGELAGGANNLTTLTLNTSAGEGLPSANRPTLMFVSKDNPACTPTTECFVDVNGINGTLTGASSLNNQDSLHVIKVENLNSNRIIKVDYFIDGKATYSTEKLENFDLRYVGNGKHKLTRVATYDSKQQVVFTEEIEQNFGDGINAIGYTFWLEHRFLLIALALVLALWLIYSILLYVVRSIYNNYIWKKTHFVETPSDLHPINEEESLKFHIQKDESEAWWMAKKGGALVLVIVCALISLIFINSFILQIFTTDGPSMQVTLHTGDKLLTNKLGSTWGKLSRRIYVPKRGEVIIFSKQSQSGLFSEQTEKQETTYVVKRVFALPGERIVIKGGKIKIYNSEFTDGFNPEKNQKWINNLQISKDDDIDIKLGTDEIFVIGDNRPESIDSRANGPVKLVYVVGNAVMRITPNPKQL